MTADEFRALALALPEAEEGEHMDHPDFRVAGKIFATLGPDGSWGMVKLAAAEQAELIDTHPAVFTPAKGAWGRGGATLVTLDLAEPDLVREALRTAWRNTAPKRLRRGQDE